MASKKTSTEIFGLKRITKKHIQELCKKDKLYQTPELNDVLYLHYQGFDCIECLDDYTELKCLWLECNAISEIQGLCKQTKLKCLFLQSNLIRKIENLEYCTELDTLNLSQNHIRKIENCGFEVLPMLNTLNLASNYLKDCDSLKALGDCKNLSVLDISNNRIDDILVVKIFSEMPELKVLVLQGNPVVSKIPQYRKTLILECKKLTFLDSRPVFSKDRACAEAWKRGGYAEERKENERWNRKERQKMRDSVNATINLRNKNRKLGDQIPRIPASDSEDETEPLKKNVKIQLHAEAGIEYIWDEVTDDQILKKCSGSYDGTEEEGTKLTMIKGIDNTEITKQNQFGEQHRILEISPSDLEDKKGSKEPEEDSSQASFAEFEEVMKPENLDEDAKLPKMLVTLKDFNDTQFKEVERDSPQNKVAIEHPDPNQDAYENYAASIATIKQINVPLCSAEECEEEKINEISQQVKNDQGFGKKKENYKSEFGNAEECIEVNNQLKTDFEELSTNMSSFLYKWGKEHEGRQEVIESLSFNLINVSKVDNCLKHKNDGKENAANYKSASNWEYSPIDISSLTHKSNEVVISLETESKVLKVLKQKLENGNDDVFKMENVVEKKEKGDESCKNVELNLKLGLVDYEHNDIFKQTTEEDILKENSDFCFENKISIEESLTNSFEEIKQVVEGILKEVLQSVDSMGLKRNLFELPNNLAENKEDFNVINNLTQHLSIPKIMPEVIKSFNQLFNKIESRQGTNKKVPAEKHDNQVSPSLKELSQKPNLKLFVAGETIEKNSKCFKPKLSKSSEDLVFTAIKQNDQTISDDESEESADEFYSLDVHDKPDLYKIDKDLFKNLSFDLSNLTQQDEDHIVQCARSYEELKTCLTLKEEKHLTEPEEMLFEKMGRRKYGAETLQEERRA